MQHDERLDDAAMRELLPIETLAQDVALAVDAHDTTIDADIESIARSGRRPHRTRRQRLDALFDDAEVGRVVRAGRDRIIDFPMEDDDHTGRDLQEPERRYGETEPAMQLDDSLAQVVIPSPSYRRAQPLRGLANRAIGERRDRD